VVDLDDDLPPLANAVLALADVVPDDAEEGVMTLQRLLLSSPVELGVRDAGNAGVLIRGTTPTQRTETTILPVWHQLTLSLVADDAG